VALPPEFAQALGQAVASHFRAPEPLELTVMSTHGNTADSLTVQPTLDTHAYVTLYRRGAFSEPVVIDGSLNLDLDEALANTFHAVDSAKAIPAFPATLPGDSVLLSVHVSSVPAGTTDWVKVKDITIPQYHLDVPARQAGNVQPAYPEEAKARAVNGVVALTFVVDEQGKVIMPTVDATRADYREFLQSTLQALPTMQFTPAKLSGCPVKQHITQSFTFTPPAK
jgi:TonB family protein